MYVQSQEASRLQTLDNSSTHSLTQSYVVNDWEKVKKERKKTNEKRQNGGRKRGDRKKIWREVIDRDPEKTITIYSSLKLAFLVTASHYFYCHLKYLVVDRRTLLVVLVKRRTYYITMHVQLSILLPMYEVYVKNSVRPCTHFRTRNRYKENAVIPRTPSAPSPVHSFPITSV